MLKMHDAELNAFQAQIYKMCHAAFSISAERKKEHLPADWVNQNARVVSGKHQSLVLNSIYPESDNDQQLTSDADISSLLLVPGPLLFLSPPPLCLCVQSRDTTKESGLPQTSCMSATRNS